MLFVHTETYRLSTLSRNAPSPHLLLLSLRIPPICLEHLVSKSVCIFCTHVNVPHGFMWILSTKNPLWSECGVFSFPNEAFSQILAPNAVLSGLSLRIRSLENSNLYFIRCLRCSNASLWAWGCYGWFRIHFVGHRKFEISLLFPCFNVNCNYFCTLHRLD